jgi:hypothetical protein
MWLRCASNLRLVCRPFIPNRLQLQLNGMQRGSEYDALDAGSLTLGGSLEVNWLDPLHPQFLHAGDSFALISAAAISGEFVQFVLPDLTPGLVWTHGIVGSSSGVSTLQTYTLSVTSVPEPSAWLLMLGGLIALPRLRRARQPKACQRPWARSQH